MTPTDITLQKIREEIEAPLRKRIAELEAALLHIIGMAGNTNAADGCRLITNRAEQALGAK